MAQIRLTAGLSCAANGTSCLGRLPVSSAKNRKLLIPCKASCFETIAPVFDRSLVKSRPRIDLNGPSTVSPNIHSESPDGSTVLVAPSAPVTPTLLSRNWLPIDRTAAISESSAGGEASFSARDGLGITTPLARKAAPVDKNCRRELLMRDFHHDLPVGFIHTRRLAGT